MNYAAGLSQLVLVVTAGLLFYVAYTDLRYYKIRNDVVVALVFLFLLYVVLAEAWTTLIWNFVFSLVLFFIMLSFYISGLMGGGDLKLLTVAFLWVGPFCALPFAIFMLIFAMIHVAAAKLKLVGTKEREDKRRSIAFAPSIAAALITVFMAGCMNSEFRSKMYSVLLHELATSFYHLMYFILPLAPHAGK